MSAPFPRSSCLNTLTAREREVLDWVWGGKSNGDIARVIHCSEGTVKKHLQHIFAKLGVETRTSAARVYTEEKKEGSGSSSSSDNAGDDRNSESAL